jgi:hypothetical protein
VSQHANQSSAPFNKLFHYATRPNANLLNPKRSPGMSQRSGACSLVDETLIEIRPHIGAAFGRDLPH